MTCPRSNNQRKLWRLNSKSGPPVFMVLPGQPKCTRWAGGDLLHGVCLTPELTHPLAGADGEQPREKG